MSATVVDVVVMTIANVVVILVFPFSYSQQYKDSIGINQSRSSIRQEGKEERRNGGRGRRGGRVGEVGIEFPIDTISGPSAIESVCIADKISFFQQRTPQFFPQCKCLFVFVSNASAPHFILAFIPHPYLFLSLSLRCCGC